MSEIVIKKEETNLIIDWEAQPVAFRTKKSVKGSDFIAYSKFLQDKLFESFNTKLTVKAGTHIGRKDVTIYFECKHNVTFTCSMKKFHFKPGLDLKFTIFRSQDQSCICSIDYRNESQEKNEPEKNQHEEDDNIQGADSGQGKREIEKPVLVQKIEASNLIINLFNEDLINEGTTEEQPKFELKTEDDEQPKSMLIRNAEEQDTEKEEESEDEKQPEPPKKKFRADMPIKRVYFTRKGNH